MKRLLHIMMLLFIFLIIHPPVMLDAQSTDKKAVPNLQKSLQALPSASKGWEVEWQKTLEAGRKEGKVTLYISSLAAAAREQAPVFANQFGIKLEIMVGRGNEILSRLETETRAGLNSADVVIAGGNSLFQIKNMGITAPMDRVLILPEVTNTKLWYTLDNLPWLDDAKHFFHFLAYPNRDIAINTDLVKPGEIQSWQDLLKPQFKDRIIWNDPTIAGSGFNGVATNLRYKVTDENYYRKLIATQGIVLSRNQRQMAEWVARGKYAMNVSVPGGAMSDFFDAGVHIAYVRVTEGTYLDYDGGNVSVAAMAPHPNAAKVYVNWLLSRAGQEFAQKASKYMSSRNDIPTGDVHPENMRVAGERYFAAINTDEKWMAEEQDKTFALIKEIFSPLLSK